MHLHIKSRLNRFIKRSHWYNEVLFKDCRKFWEIEDKQYDVVNLGSGSGVSDFCYDSCGISGANWAITPQSMVGDFVILKQFRNHIKDGGVVIYPLCPFSAISGAVPYLEERCYSFVDYKSFPSGHYITNCKIQAAKDYPLAIYPLLHFVEDIKWHLRGNNEKTIVKTEEELVVDAKGKIDSWKKQFNIDDLNERFIDQFEEVYNASAKMLSDIIEYCQSEGLKIVIVVPPVYHTLGHLLTPVARQQLLESFVEQANGKRVPYYDFLDDPKFSNAPQLFKDSYNLNMNGAMEFTKYLLDIIKEK